MSVFKFRFAALFAVAALALGACSSAPIYNVNDAAITASGKSDAQVRKAIIDAGTALGWQITEVKPGLLLGTLHLREHTAIVDIPYTAKSYSILYKSSVNLAEKSGQIHKNYNGWVQNLDQRIRVFLANT